MSIGQLTAAGTVSSNGFITTTQANQVFKMLSYDGYDASVNSIYIEANTTNDVTVKFNNETYTHKIKAGNYMKIGVGFEIKKITIVENGVSFSYNALRY